MKRTGKNANDIFATTAENKKVIGKDTEKKRPGRPVIHKEEWSKVTIVLLTSQIVFLDRLSSDIRAKTGKAVKRAEIIRALIDAMVESDNDFTSVSSGDELKALFLKEFH